MPRRFDRLGLEPSRIQAMHSAYDRARAALRLSDVPDKINEILVMKIVELGKKESNPERLCEQVLAFYRKVDK